MCAKCSAPPLIPETVFDYMFQRAQWCCLLPSLYSDQVFMFYVMFNHPFLLFSLSTTPSMNPVHRCVCVFQVGVSQPQQNAFSNPDLQPCFPYRFNPGLTLCCFGLKGLFFFQCDRIIWYSLLNLFGRLWISSKPSPTELYLLLSWITEKLEHDCQMRVASLTGAQINKSH